MAKKEKKDVTVEDFIKSHGFSNIDEAFVYACEVYSDDYMEFSPIIGTRFSEICCRTVSKNKNLVISEICSGDPDCTEESVVGYNFSEKDLKHTLGYLSDATHLLCIFISEYPSISSKISESLKIHFVQDLILAGMRKVYVASVECSGILFAPHEFAIYNEIKEEFQKAFISEICEHYEI